MPRGSSILSKKAVFYVVFATVSILLLAGSLWVVNFVRGTVVEAAEETGPSAEYIEYSHLPNPYYTTEAAVAAGAYVEDFPEPQNVQVLTGMTTAEIWAFMIPYMSGGMRVNCDYCHNLANFGDDGVEGVDDWADRKANAREHLLMVQDLNRNWLPELATVAQKQPSGSQIICATCHNGEPQPLAWEAELEGLPDDYRLPLDNLDVLLVTGKDDQYSLDAVQYNQWTMYHMNTSLNVGCTHCHNSRYFPSYEQPAKYYALTMLMMNQHILANYQESMNEQQPSCVMCHQERILPPGAVTSVDALPAALTTEGLSESE